MDSLQRRWSKFKDKEYRDEYAAAQFDIELPFQIRALREARGWSCKELAERSGIPARSLTKLEETGQGTLITTDILCRLASAFDVGILVQFISFSELVYRAESLHPGTFKIASFDDDALALPKTTSQKMDTEKNVYVIVASTPMIKPTYRKAAAQIVIGSYKNLRTSPHTAWERGQPYFSVGKEQGGKHGYPAYR